VLIFGKTDVGKMRASNQDEFRFQQLDDHAAFALICDGMGGENGGQVASKIASDTISKRIVEYYQSGLSDEEYKNMIISAVSDGNMAVYDKSLEDKQYAGMGTTAIFAMILDDRAFLAHVGDSRIYLLRDGELYQVTKDHSLVQALLEQGKITPAEADHHPQKNLVTRAVGISCFVDIDYIEITNLEDSALLLCSDGLTNTCSDELIQDTLNRVAPEQVCDTLVDLANEAGGVDNITVVYMANR
jgi:serine/threonine protein phosphatase PrpC